MAAAKGILAAKGMSEEQFVQGLEEERSAVMATWIFKLIGMRASVNATQLQMQAEPLPQQRQPEERPNLGEGSGSRTEPAGGQGLAQLQGGGEDDERLTEVSEPEDERHVKEPKCRCHHYLNTGAATT